MSSYFEYDLIRPLGLVTLYFGYAEAQVNTLIEMLNECGLKIAVSSTASFGYKVAALSDALKPLTCNGVAEIQDILAEAKVLFEQRNALIHGCILSKGRVVPNDPTKNEFYVTSEDLTALADRVFNWKERLYSKVQRQLIPALRDN